MSFSRFQVVETVGVGINDAEIGVDLRVVGRGLCQALQLRFGAQKIGILLCRDRR